MPINPMRFRAEITVNFEAGCFETAGAHQRALTNVFEALRSDYPDAKLSLHQLRFRSDGANRRPVSAPRVRQDILNYED